MVVFPVPKESQEHNFDKDYPTHPTFFYNVAGIPPSMILGFLVFFALLISSPYQSSRLMTESQGLPHLYLEF